MSEEHKRQDVKIPTFLIPKQASQHHQPPEKRSCTSIYKAPSQLFSDQLQNVRKSQTLIGISDKAFNMYGNQQSNHTDAK